MPKIKNHYKIYIIIIRFYKLNIKITCLINYKNDLKSILKQFDCFSARPNISFVKKYLKSALELLKISDMIKVIKLSYLIT